MDRAGRAGPALTSAVACMLALALLGPAASAGASPDPMVVEVELATDVSTTSLVTTEQGGYLSLFAPDGTMYALTIPPDAVLSDLDMTMTLVTSVTGSPLGEELVGAVDIGPSGLELLRPAMLTITPMVPLPVAQEGPFTSRTDGADFHMTPLMSDPATLTIPIFHLTVFGVVRSDQQHRADTLRNTVATVEAQLSQEMAQVLQTARETILAGGESDLGPVVELLDRYGETIVVPLMAAAETDHTLFAQALGRWLSWERQRQLLGIEDPDLASAILESFKRAFANYVKHTKERCYAHDFGVVIDYLRLARMDALMGGILGLADRDAEPFLHDCLTFTLEMDSRAAGDMNTCLIVDGAARWDLRLRASVVMHYDDPGPWVGPMRWVTGAYRGECHTGSGGVVEIDAKVTATGFADPKELTVLAWKPELNVTAKGEETTAVLRLQHVIVQPGDPELSFETEGNASMVILGIASKDDSTATGPAGWLSSFRSSAGGTPVDAELDGAIVLADWVPTGNGDELARRDHKESSKSAFGSASNDTTFILRHTPIR